MGLRDLKGPWALYWQKHLEPTDVPGEPDAFVEAGKTWNALQTTKGETLPGIGWASLRLRLDSLPSSSESFILKFQDLSSAAKIYLYPEGEPARVHTVKIGQASQTKDYEKPSRHSQSLSFYPEGKTWIVLIQISNHHSSKGGLWKTPSLGPQKDMRRMELITFLQTALAMGVMLAIGIYSLLIWARNRSNMESLWLFFMSIGSLFRAISVQEITMSMLPDAAYHALRALEYSTMLLGPLSYVIFLDYSFLAKESKRASYVLISVGLILAFIPWVTPQWFYGQLLPLNQIFLLVLLSLSMKNLIRAVRAKERHTNLAILGIVVIIFAFVLDYGFATGLLNVGFYTMPSAIAVFLLMQAQIVAAHSADAFAKAEYLSQELREKEKARTLFFHNTSHELRTPLNGIIGFLDLVRQGMYGSVAQEAKDQISKALRLAESLKIQVNTILDLAKSRRGELGLKYQSLSLDELYRESCHLAEGLSLKGNGLSFQSNWISDKSTFIGDREKVFTILRNLLGNAFKFRDPARENRIVLFLHLSHGQLTIEVADTGIGIPAEAREKIFEEFAQVQGDARRGYEGTGLGLAMVRDLVKLMQGSMVLESELGVGSRFIVRIPSAAASVLDTLASESQQEFETKMPDFSASSEYPQVGSTVVGALQVEGEPWNICVIDDNETNCEVIAGILKIDGYHVRYAVSGRVGLAEMRRLRPDLLLLDMMMPEMSGEDVLAEMRADPLLQEIPVILITARASEEDRIAGLKLGADDYLPKPIFAAELRLRVHNMVHRHKLLRQVEKSEQDDKMLHLGELFGDLSHELKNILNNANASFELEPEDGIFSASVLSLDESQQLEYGTKLVSSSLPSKESLRRFQQLNRMLGEHNTKALQDLAYYLADTSLDEKTLLTVWSQLKESTEAEIHFAASQGKLFYQYKLLMSSLNRSKDLTYSVLSYTRSSEDSPTSQLEECWRQVSRLLQTKIRNANIRIEGDPGEYFVYITLSRLTQVLINLILNALDALDHVQEGDRWIRIMSTQVDDWLQIRVQNGGPAIPERVQKNLFQRGFSTKGNKGSGIGLYVSRRILREAGGDLILDVEEKSPCFVVSVLLAHESGVPLSAATSPKGPRGALGA